MARVHRSKPRERETQELSEGIYDKESDAPRADIQQTCRACETTTPKRPADALQRHDRARSTVSASGEDMAAAGSGSTENGGVSLISEIGNNELRRGSFSSSSSSSVSSASDVDAHSMTSAQDSAASTLSEPEPMASNGVGVGSSDGLGVGVDTAAARSKPHKRTLSQDAPRVVEQETPTNGQQLRKACDLCTKVWASDTSQTD